MPPVPPEEPLYEPTSGPLYWIAVVVSGGLWGLLVWRWNRQTCHQFRTDLQRYHRERQNYDTAAQLPPSHQRPEATIRRVPR